MDGVQKANAGHPGTAMALAPLAYLLYTEVMRPQPGEPAAGPTATASSSPPGTRASSSTRRSTSPGYDLSLEELKRFRQWGSLHARPSRGAPHAGDRGDDRAARPGLRERRRLGDRRALPRRALQPARTTRSSTTGRLRDLLRRRPDGGRLERGGVDRRPRSASASSSTSTTTTTSRSTARRRSPSRRTAASGSRRRAGTCSTSTT